MYPVFAPLVALLLALVVVALATPRFEAIHLALAYLLFAVLALNQYDSRVHDGISPLFSLQTALVFAMGRAGHTRYRRSRDSVA